MLSYYWSFLVWEQKSTPSIRQVNFWQKRRLVMGNFPQSCTVRSYIVYPKNCFTALNEKVQK